MDQKRRNKLGYKQIDEEDKRIRKAEKKIKRKLKEKSRRYSNLDKEM